jgi:hypothetical protein
MSKKYQEERDAMTWNSELLWQMLFICRIWTRFSFGKAVFIPSTCLPNTTWYTWTAVLAGVGMPHEHLGELVKILADIGPSK